MSISKLIYCKQLYYILTVQDQNNSFFISYLVNNMLYLLGHEFVPSATPLLPDWSRLQILLFSLLCCICGRYLLMIILVLLLWNDMFYHEIDCIFLGCIFVFRFPLGGNCFLITCSDRFIIVERGIHSLFIKISLFVTNFSISLGLWPLITASRWVYIYRQVSVLSFWLVSCHRLFLPIWSLFCHISLIVSTFEIFYPL